MDLQHIRRQYTKGGLRRDTLPDCPIDLFNDWQSQAVDAGLGDPTGCVLATLQPDGTLRQRFVLLKAVDSGCFVFFSNYSSAKAQAITANPEASLLFPWNELDRQVIIGGRVARISSDASDEYFVSRPLASQLAAWTSAQSQTIESRTLLEARFKEIRERFENQPISRPSNWGGYMLKPKRIEFWQGGENRLHDRFEYRLSTSTVWSVVRLQP